MCSLPTINSAAKLKGLLVFVHVIGIPAKYEMFKIYAVVYSSHWVPMLRYYQFSYDSVMMNKYIYTGFCTYEIVSAQFLIRTFIIVNSYFLNFLTENKVTKSLSKLRSIPLYHVGGQNLGAGDHHLSTPFVSSIYNRLQILYFFNCRH